ncbi:MAG TPA: matrixin family metalloprotease [Planctomycetota bacterium]|nr:matrixin family metalloprotease [Planctomycetota bacterium]
MSSTLHRSLSALGLVAGLSLIATLARPTQLAGFTLTGESLALDQRDFRVFNNFTDPQANDNVAPHPNFPGHTGAVMAIWKAHCEWGSLPRGGNGLGDGLASNANLGDGGANFDNTFQGLASSGGGTNGNVHSASPGLGGGLLAFTATPASDGWSIVYGDAWSWDDGPGAPGNGTADLQSVATHEIGHALGLGHSGVGGATMAAAIAGDGTNQRSLAADDIAGLQAIYGVASPAKPRIEALSGSTDPGGLLSIHGLNFAPAGNEAWFTKAASDGTPSKVTGLAAAAGGTRIDVIIPADAEAGEVLVRIPGASGAALSNAFPADVGSPPGGFALTGPGVESAGELPQLTGEGDLSPGGAGFDLFLRLLPSAAPGALFVSLNEANLPFKGGVFDPAPVLAQFLLVTPPSGELGFSVAMPAAVPPGTGFVTQAWFVDAGAPLGVSATNALRLDVP